MTLNAFSIRCMAADTPRRGKLRVLEDSIIAVDGDGRILSVTQPSEAEYSRACANHAAHPRAITLGKGQFLLPGLIDLHIHAPQWPQLGKALHLPLQDWLQKNTFPLEARFADFAFARQVYESLVGALLANGTTTAVYFATIHNEASLALAEICLARGQRAFVGRVAMDDPGQCPDYYRDTSAEAALAGTIEFVGAVHSLRGNEKGSVQPILTPRFIPSCSDRLLAGLGRLAQDTGCAVQTHCSESDWEHGYVLARLGRSDTAALSGFGLLTRRSVLAHGNFIAGADWETIRNAGSGIAHCPLSNMYFSNAVFPLRAALDKGLHVGLGSDIAGGHSPSMFDACRHAVAGSRVLEDGVDPARAPGERGRAGSRIDFAEAFWLATAGGAQVLDLPTGRFAPGLHFDALLLDAEAPGSNIYAWPGLDSPADLVQKIVYNATRANIRATWVGGRQVHGA